MDSPRRSNQRKTSSETKAETSAPNKIEISNRTRAGSGSENRNSRNETDNNRPHSNNNTSNSAHNKIETDNRNKIDSNKPHNSSNSNGHSSNASKKIATGSNKFKIESNSEPSNSEHKMRNSAGRDSSANEMSTCDRVQIRNRGTFGRSIGRGHGNLSTAAGSNEAAIAVIAYPTTGTGDPLAAVITSGFTGNR